MTSIPIGAIIVATLFGSALLAMLVARLLPDHHLSPETKSVVSVSTAVVGTLSALVLGLFISTANTSFMAKDQNVTEVSTDVIGLDRLLRRYGAEAQDVRVLLRQYTAAILQDLFPKDRSRPPELENYATLSILEELQTKILALKPANDTQTWLQAQALQVAAAIMTARWQLVQEDASRTPQQLLVLMMFWFAVIFASFGLFAPRNITAIVAILLCSIGIGSAIRMTTELQSPFTGFIRISSAPMVHALDVIGR